jgi:hypothetical protein
MGSRIILDLFRQRRILAAACLLSTTLPAVSAQEDRNADVAPPPADAPAVTRDAGIGPKETSSGAPPGATREANVPATAGPGTRTVPRIEYNVTEIRPDKAPVAGATLVLQTDSRLAEGTNFLWLQVEGPPIEIKDPTRPVLQVTIPPGVERLEFLVVESRPERTIVERVNVPLQPVPAAPLAVGEASPIRAWWGPRGSGKIKADAGDDQVGLVGHRVTLNGSRSTPADGKNWRWLQLGGPSITAPQQQGSYFSFVPTSPGLYRFMLVVVADGEVPEADEVSILVGSVPTGTGMAPPSPFPLVAASPAIAPPAAPTLEQSMAAILPRVANGPAIAARVADALQAISDRATLYGSFGELQSELVRRLEAVIPNEPTQRAVWNEGIFGPLTIYTINQLLASGLDVRQPAGLERALTATQQTRLQNHFQSLAQLFRAAATR